MEKDYSIWSPLKSKINNFSGCPIGFKERQIWYASIGENIEFEEDGKGKKFDRPVLILKVFSKRLCLIIPLTTKNNLGKFYFSFNGNTGKISTAILSQIKTIDSVRLHYKIGNINQEDFLKLKEKLRKLTNL